jgi:hypothetical protein
LRYILMNFSGHEKGFAFIPTEMLSSSGFKWR